jgi:hypothetical protein
MVQLSATRCKLCRYFASQSSEFCRHNPLCCFSKSVFFYYYYCCCWFRYRLSPGTFGYTLVKAEKNKTPWPCPVNDPGPSNLEVTRMPYSCDGRSWIVNNSHIAEVAVVIFGQEADHSHFLSIGIIQSPICLQSQRRTAKTHSSDTIAEISLTAGLTINCPPGYQK